MRALVEQCFINPVLEQLQPHALKPGAVENIWHPVRRSIRVKSSYNVGVEKYDFFLKAKPTVALPPFSLQTSTECQQIVVASFRLEEQQLGQSISNANIAFQFDACNSLNCLNFWQTIWP